MHDPVTLTLPLPKENLVALNVEAAEVGMTPEEWITSLVRARLDREIPWSMETLGHLEAAARAIKQIADLAKDDPSSLKLSETIPMVMDRFIRRVNEAADKQRTYWYSPAFAQMELGQGAD